MMLLWVLIGLISLTLLFSLACFFIVFYCPKRKKLGENEFVFPTEKVYAPYREKLAEWMVSARTLPHEDVEITSFDKLKLRGRYYEKQNGAPIEILFNGYRGSAERDLSAGIERCFSLNRNVLVVDQRACGRSDGFVTTFGIRERFDAVKWAEFANEKFGENATILLGGVSLGGATVLNASSMRLPKNVKCILSDCSFSSPKEIITKVIKDMKLPPLLIYPFIWLGARIFGGFNLEETTPAESVKNTDLPVYLVHGGKDDYVPFYMAEKIYENIKTNKKALVKIENAGHGLAYPADKELYVEKIREFEKVWK